MNASAIASEAEVLDAVLDVLQAHRVTAWRMNVGVVKYDDRVVKFGTPGFADVLAIPIVSGKFRGLPVSWCAPVFIEVKSPTGRQSSEQKSFQRQVCDAGAEYWIVRSPEDLTGKLREHGVIA